MRICVTGAAGYLGSVLTPMLLQAGHEVVGVDSLMYGQFTLAECFANPKFTFVRGDCRDSKLVGSLIAESDFFLPLAAIVGAPACDLRQNEAWEVNCQAIKDVVPFLLKSGCRVIFPNTNSGYQSGSDMLCTEDSPLEPVSYYGHIKVRAEEVVLDLNGISLRLATLMGMSPRMRFDLLVNDFCYRAATNRCIVLFEPHFRRNYLHVRDAASIFLWGIDRFDQMVGRVYNAGLPDANLTKRELAERIKHQIPDLSIIEAPIGSDPDKRDYICDNSRILATGWKPKHCLDGTIAEVLRAMPIFQHHQQWRNA